MQQFLESLQALLHYLYTITIQVLEILLLIVLGKQLIDAHLGKKHTDDDEHKTQQ